MEHSDILIGAALLSQFLVTGRAIGSAIGKY